MGVGFGVVFNVGLGIGLLVCLGVGLGVGLVGGLVIGSDFSEISDINNNIMCYSYLLGRFRTQFEQAHVNDLLLPLCSHVQSILIVHHSWINGSLFGAMNENITVLYTNSMLAHILWILR